jgi:hypothetical protein
MKIKPNSSMDEKKKKKGSKKAHDHTDERPSARMLSKVQHGPDPNPCENDKDVKKRQAGGFKYKGTISAQKTIQVHKPLSGIYKKE